MPELSLTRSPAVLDALRLPTRGIVFDLDPGRFTGMPIWAGHPPFQVLAYRTARGIRVQGDQDWLAPEVNAEKIALNSELVIATCHSGCHIDSLAHIVCGDDEHWYGGAVSGASLGDFGPTVHDASTIKPIITRGVLVDIAGSLGRRSLSRSYPISSEEFEQALHQRGCSLRPGDVVLVRTGQMAAWPDRAEMDHTHGAGITRAVADLAVQAGVVAVGTDTESCEVVPSIEPDNPHPVHQRLLIEAGVYIIENVYLEELAAAQVYEFLFLALAPKITGATGGMLRPVAIV